MNKIVVLQCYNFCRENKVNKMLSVVTRSSATAERARVSVITPLKVIQGR